MYYSAGGRAGLGTLADHGFRVLRAPTATLRPVATETRDHTLVPFRGALVMILLLVACGSDGANSTRHKAPSTVASPVTTGPATSAPTGAVGCPSGIGTAAQSADEAARCLYAAWKAADRAGAAVFASVDVVDALFRQPWSPPEGRILPCTPDPQAGEEVCRYDHHGDAYVLSVRPSEGGWRVTQLQGP